MCRNVNNIHLCHMHGTPTSTCETPAIYTVCAYQTLRAVFSLSLLYVFFYTISIYECEFVSGPVCVCSICLRVCLLCVHVYMQIAFSHHQHHMQHPLPHAQPQHPPTTTTHNHHHIQPPPPPPHTTTTATYNHHHHHHTV